MADRKAKKTKKAQVGKRTAKKATPPADPPPKAMATDAAQLTAWEALRAAQFETYDKRRSFEWKITLGFIVGVAGITAAIVEKGIALSGPQYFAFILMLGLLYAVYCWTWTPGLVRANAIDRFFEKHYRSRIEGILTGKPMSGAVPDVKAAVAAKEITWKNWSPLSQVIGVGILVLACCLLVGMTAMR